MANFDITSDVHWDLWVNPNLPEQEQIEKFIFMFSHAIPKNHSENLIIAGDIGHFVEQNFIVFKILKTFYKNIIWCHGNHDLYLVNVPELVKYHGNSFQKLNTMVQLANTIPGVHYLGGNVVTIDGVNIGGSCLWYDYSYGVRQFHLYKKYFDMLWKNWSDCVFIRNGDKEFDNIKYFQEQQEACLNIDAKIDIFVSHMIPLNELISRKWAFEHTTSFYVFNGKKLINKFNPKIWLYGHTHDHGEMQRNDTKFINRSFGYPIDRNWADHPETSMHKFAQIEI
jgi:Icc-related predicted phosphoesterase